MILFTAWDGLMRTAAATTDSSIAYRCRRCGAPASLVPVPRSRPLQFKYKCSATAQGCGAESLPKTPREIKAEKDYAQRMKVDASRRIAQRQNPMLPNPWWAA